MAAPKLLDIIRERSQQACADIREKMSADAEAIVAKARQSAESMKAQAIEKVQSEAEQLRERKRNALLYRINAKRYELKAEAIESIWREAESAVSELERSDNFASILEKLFFECVDDIPDGSTVCAASGDAETVKRCIDRSGRTLTFEEDSSVHGGVVFRWPDGKVVLRNTLQFRLARLKGEGNADLSAILFEGHEDGGI